jgi:HTH-type transcriptional regulator/antitoxin HigA
VLVPAIKGSHVSGVARWLDTSRPLIQLSLYGKTNDKFWFTLFHEAAHILLHSQGKKSKESVYLDDPNHAASSSDQEREANAWARDWLIPKVEAAELTTLKSKPVVREFAHRLGIHPGIVVGRLQHDGLIPPSWMNDLKESYRIVASD